MKLCEYINQMILRKILLLVWVKLKSLASSGISAHHNHQTTIICTHIGFIFFGGGYLNLFWLDPTIIRRLLSKHIATKVYIYVYNSKNVTRLIDLQQLHYSDL